MTDQKPSLGIDPLRVFAEPMRQLSACQDECIVVLDTNVLLVPYNVGKTSLADIVAKYKALADKKRLVIPAQVAIEFARNRTKKIGEIIQNLSNISSGVKVPQDGDFPVLASTGEYQAYVTKRDSLKQAIKDYQDSIESIVGRIRAWEWDDPVAVAYRGVLKDCVVELPQTTEALDQECKKRYAMKLPPGYKDAAKEDGGGGDFLIWKTVLKVAAERKSPIIFVTGEEKQDWVYRANNKVLAPRYELVDEFRRESGGKEFFLISLVEFLRLFHAKQETIKQVKFWADEMLDRYFSETNMRICELSQEFMRAKQSKDTESGIAVLKRFWAELTDYNYPDLYEVKYEVSVLLQTIQGHGFDRENFTKGEFWTVGSRLLRQAKAAFRRLP